MTWTGVWTSVCVWNIWRDATLLTAAFHGLNMLFVSMQGAAGNVIVLQPTKTAMTFCDIDPGRWIDVPANFQKWEEAQPKNLHVVSFDFSIYCTVVAIWNYFRSNMYGSATSEPSSEQGRRKHTSHWSSRRVNQSFLSVCRDCFVHERCTPQQNSQWCFWASVSLIPLSDKVVWALRGKLV